MAKFEFIAWLLEWLNDFRAFAFEWDSGNETKSQIKHSVGCKEVEEIFLNRKWVPLGIQVLSVVCEPRFGILGKTNQKRLLFAVFTIRGNIIRVISARPMNSKERRLYEQICKD